MGTPTPDITYVFRDDTTYAIHRGKVIAASTNPDEVERLVKQAFSAGGPSQMPPPPADMGGEDPLLGPGGEDDHLGPPNAPGDVCPMCGSPIDPMTGQCPGCGHDGSNPYGPIEETHAPFGEVYQQERQGQGLAKVITPNGLKGTVLGKVAGVWGDEVTVRLENGRIVRLPVGTTLRQPKQAAAQPKSPLAHLERRLAATPDGTRQSLVDRHAEVTRIAEAAAELVREGANYVDSVRLDQIHVVATNEGLEIVEAIDALDDAEAIEAPRSFSISAAKEAAGISREDASWLDHTLDEMVKEAEATDFTKLMDEGPEAFAAELPDAALADTGVTRQMASSYISEKTAGIDRTVADPYMTTFLTRVEDCRRAELAGRKQTIHKEAADTEDKYRDLPDEALFL